MEIQFVDLRKQYNSIKNEISEAISNVIENSAYIGGSFVEKFESEFARFCSLKHCVGLGNGTDAIFVALKALGVGSGDEVITTANSFVATSEAISLAGAKVVFCDICEDTLNINPDLIENKITKKTRAIIPVHLYGQPAAMDRIVEIAERNSIYFVEDCAQAHGAKYKGRKVGTFGEVGCFSFYPGKNLGAYGDGGAIVTNDGELERKIRMYANHGRSKKYDHEFEGINSRLDGMQAAILSVKLRYLKEWNFKRKKIALIYNDKLKDVGDIITPFISKDIEHVFHLYVVRTKKRDELRKFLSHNSINTGIHYPTALPNLKAYRYLGYKASDFAVSSMIQDEVLSLPMYPELTRKEIDYIVNTIKKFYSKVS